MSFTPDEVDLALLRALRDDGRRSITALAGDLHLSRSAVHQRLDGLTEAGAVKGFAPIVDTSRLGAGISAFVLLSAGQSVRPEMEPIRERLRALPHVEYAALVTGEADVLLLVRVADMEQLRGFLLEELTGIGGLRGSLTLLVLDEVVHRPFLLPGE
jgi:Lrp/AsnC family transcriptional regulator, leucine-responsive regulatory protein